MWTVGRCIVYNRNGLMLLYVPLFLSLQFSSITIFHHTFLRNCVALKVETLFSRGQWTDSCVPESGYCCLFVPSFLHFSFNFLSHFSQELKLRRLKLGTHMDSWQIYRVYWNQATATYLSFFTSSFFFLNFFCFSNFQLIICLSSQIAL